MRWVILIIRGTAQQPIVTWDTGLRIAAERVADAKVYAYAEELGSRVTVLATDPTIVELQIERAPG